MNKIFGFFFSLIAATVMSIAQTPTISYHLAMPKPATHIFEVEIRFEHLPAKESILNLTMPAWRPGRYMILDLAGGIQNFFAVDVKNELLQSKKIDKAAWQVNKGNATTVVVHYNVYANEFALRTRGLNSEHAFVDGAAVFMYAEKFRSLAVQLTVQPYNSWHVTTGLEHAPNSLLTFTAPDYDYFVDCPLEIGNQHDFEFISEGKKHILSMYGNGNWNADTLIRDITKLISINKQLWGDLPYSKYVFMIHCTPNAGGGTEHINSTIMGAKPFIFKHQDSYSSFLGLVSHEYFHTWNVKQFRPKGIQPYDYSKENYIEELWIAEGTTSYYGPLFMMRAGFKTAQSYIDGIPAIVQEDRARTGNAVQSLNESSYDAWIKFWRPLQNSYNAQSDYYSKGAYVSMLLDLEIRQRSQNKFSLDDVMAAMYKNFPLTSSGYTVTDFQKVAEQCAGVRLEEFFAGYVRGTKAIPWEIFLFYAGLELKTTAAVSTPSLGATLQDVGEKTKITRIISNSPAEQNGLEVDDEILAFNSIRVRAAELNERIKELHEGEKATLTIFRNDILKEITITARVFGTSTYTIKKNEKPTPLQISIYESWLKEKWNPASK